MLRRTGWRSSWSSGWFSGWRWLSFAFGAEPVVLGDESQRGLQAVGVESSIALVAYEHHLAVVGGVADLAALVLRRD